MEMFIFWWEISGEIKEAADLNLIKKILFFFVVIKDIQRKVEDMTCYVD